MTVSDFFNVVSENPFLLMLYFGTMPFIALLAWIFGRGEGHLVPWKYLYSTLIYLSCIPGIFAIALTAFLILIEGHSVMNLNIHMTMLPLFSMLLTLFLIKRNTSLGSVPGFDKISGFLIMIFVCIVLFWGLSKIRVLAFTYISFQYFIMIFVGLLLIMVFGWRKFTR